ncbi:MAG: hypothetical protein LAO08_15425 [Acidobacteriia bacterium]|nr:hypothetical protein [Terriglobia bacterium]
MESNLHPDVESQKRRTTRIVQAVPLTVTGVDALGRPFQERTSSLIINCHGCRYQSKHYVLKNMWVTFEVPHNEPGREPRTVRARVTWIQRPRTVRELFQIGVELEVPGNVWGIAFPPSDWFPFPESPSSLEVAPLPQKVEPPPVAEWVAEEPPKPREPEAQPERQEQEEPEDNIRVLPLPAAGAGGGDASMQMARQVARMVAEAKQQVQSTVRESANTAVAAETRPLMAALQNQMKEAAEKSVAEAAAAYIERTYKEQQQRMQRELESSAAAMRAEWSRELDQRIAEARLHVDSQLAEIERVREADFGQQIQSQLQSAIEKLQNLGGSLNENADHVRSTIEQLRRDSAEAAANETRQWQDLIAQRASNAQERLAQLEQAAQRLEDQIAEVTISSESGWRQLLDAEVAAANARWNGKVEASFEEAARRTVERLTQNSEAVAKQAEHQLQERISILGSAYSQVTAEAENKLAGLRASINHEAAQGATTIAQMQQAVEQVKARRGELNALLQKTLEDWAQRSQMAVEAHGAELNSRAEAAIAGMAERLQPVLETAGNETITRLAGELNERLSPEIARAGEVMNKLAQGREQSEKAVAEHQNRIWQISERSVQDSVARTKELLARVEKDFVESARTTSGKWFSELETKATETTHSTFEALFKSAEWYEKKVQTQMQTTLEKGMDQATATLRDKAGEMSGLFASELDHYSRSYVEHAQNQIQENAREAAEHAGELMAEASAKATANFTERVGQLGKENLDLYASKTDIAFEQSAARMEAHTAQVRSKLESDTRAFALEYHRAISQHTEQSLMQGKEDLAAHIESAKQALRLETEALDRQFQSSVQSLGAHAMDEHKQRLDNASNSWLLTTVTKLNQQSEGLIEQLAATTEKKLRTVCGNVFAEMGETLRQRLLAFSSPFAGPLEPGAPPAASNPSEIKSEDPK